jgi:predicted esterase
MGLAWAPPLYPPSIRPLLEAPARKGAYKGKKILSIHGEVDTLVPLKEGRRDIDEIVREAEEGDVEVWVVQGKGHVVTKEMVERTAEWVWRWAMKA